MNARAPLKKRGSEATQGRLSRRRRASTSGQNAHPSPAGEKGAVPTSPYEAFRQVVMRYGVPELAALLLLKPGTLYNKCDSDAETHAQPTLRDVIEVTRHTGDMLILDSLDRLFDRAAYPAAPPSVCSDEALLELLLKVGSDHGDLCAAVHKALADERFSRAELAHVRGEAFDLISQVLGFVQRLEGLVDE